MKKFLLSIALCCISIVGMAQNDVTKFLGIPVDGSKNALIQQLKAKGFKSSPYQSDILTGRFNGMDVNVYIVTNNDKVCRIMVSDQFGTDETNIRIRFNNLCSQFKNNSKYLSQSEELPIIPDGENIFYEMNVNKKRYEAVFFQLPDMTKESYLKEYMDLVYSKYTIEQVANPTQEVKEDMERIANTYNADKVNSMPVWFMISKNLGQYYISIYYDNRYNQANGEDL